MPEEERDPGRGVYGISVAAELTGLGVQMLRQYEERGLLRPQRTGGGTRRYSEDDLERLRRIRDLLAGGLNLAGVGLVLELEDSNGDLRDDNTGLRHDNAGLRDDNHRLERANHRLEQENDRLRTAHDAGAATSRRPGRKT